jgi:hypothetical protein
VVVFVGRPITAPDTGPVTLTRVSEIRKDPRVTPFVITVPVGTISSIVEILKGFYFLWWQVCRTTD